MGARHEIPGLGDGLEPARALHENAPLPYYLAVGGRIRRTVRKGQPLCWGDVDLAPHSTLLRLRQAQDDSFLRP